MKISTESEKKNYHYVIPLSNYISARVVLGQNVFGLAAIYHIRLIVIHHMFVIGETKETFLDLQPCTVFD